MAPSGLALMAAALSTLLPRAAAVRLAPRGLAPASRLLCAAASGDASPPSPAPRRLALYTKPGCCLCDSLKEKLHATILLAGTPYSLASLELQVTSPYGNTLHENGNATVGQFAFTTIEAGNFLACFWIDSAEKGSGISVNLDWKTGIATKDWDAIAKKDKIEVRL